MFRFTCGIGRVYSLTLMAVTLVVIYLVYLGRERSRVAVSDKSESQGKKRVKLPRDIPLLNQAKVDEVQTFLFFIGYPRSGHSIVAACLDAHPDVIIAHEYNLFKKLADSERQAKLMNRTVLYSNLYQNSVKASKSGCRSPHSDGKGYTLYINTTWQGKFRNLRVIGDKSGAITSRIFQDSPLLFEKILNKLKDILQIPIKTLHVVRNPYDMVATRLLFQLSSEKDKKAKFTASKPLKDKQKINKAIHGLRSEAEAVKAFSEQWQSSVLELHNLDYIHDTHYKLLRLCVFLKLDCGNDFLKACKNATFKKPSRSRRVLSWTNDHKTKMKKLINDFPFFKRYSFESE